MGLTAAIGNLENWFIPRAEISPNRVEEFQESGRR